MPNPPDKEMLQRAGEAAEKFGSSEISRTSEMCPQSSTLRPTRAKALQDVYDEAEKRGVKILTDEDPEIRAYMDNAAKREGVRPEDMHAITLGDNIVVRQQYADNVRVLREELIHTQQQVEGFAIGPGRDTITEMELDARRQLLENKDKWALTDEEVAEVEREMVIIKERGRY